MARDTSHIRLGVMATCVGYRNHAYFAKIASTVDTISKGRLIVGIGAGWYEDEYKAYGYPYLPDSQRVGQLREALQIVRKSWTEDKASFKKHYQVEGAVNIPKPVEKYPPIIVGITKGTRVLPRIAIQQGDGFNTTGSPALYKELVAAAEKERHRTGRSRDSVSYSVQAFILTGSEKQVEDLLREGARWRGAPLDEHTQLMKQRWIMGSPDSCAERLREYLGTGVDHLLLVVEGDRLGWPLEVVRDELVPLL